MARFTLSFRRGPMAVAALLVIVAGQLLSQTSRYEELKQQAAALYSEKSYRLAHERWQEAAAIGVPEGDRRILDFYLADSLWRSRPDDAEVESARAELRKIGEDAGAGALSAEAWESLGDSWLAIEDDWDRAWTDYQRALNDWAASTDIDRARPRYLGIVWKATGPPGNDHRVQRVPLEVLANAAEIATTTEDRARAHFFLGVHLAAGDVYSVQRAGREFQAAVDAGTGTAVYEQALFKLGEWQVGQGRSTWNQDGTLQLEPDYAEALKTFRRFVKEFPEGASSLWSAAKAQIREITEPVLTVNAWGQCLPGQRPKIDARWRNVGELTFTLSRVDLLAAFRPTPQTEPGAWLNAVNIGAGDTVRQWKEPGADAHASLQKVIDLDPIEEPGTYLVEAAAGGRKSRTLVIVTKAAAVLRPVGGAALAFLCDASTGARAEGDVAARIWQVEREDDNRFVWTAVEPASVDGGLARFDLPATKEWHGNLLLFGGIAPQPVVVDMASRSRIANAGEWRIQVFTDRAAYRPAESVKWRLIARTVEGGALRTPAGELLKFRIVDPRGEPVREGEVKLTEFGGAWGELELGADAPLGEYSIQFSKEDRGLGGDRLFRLEEYRLPELKVDVSVAADSGVRLGDELEADVRAEYYFGGAVADAEVTVVVREGPNFRPLPAVDARSRIAMPPFRAEKTVLTETVRTGPDGRASVRLLTPFDAPGDLRYEIEARVVDASGREVVGVGSIVVGRQSYFAELTPSRRVAQPGDAIQVSIVAKDGNDRKVETDGVIVLTRQRWTEVWRDPRGREVAGEELDQLRRGVFPPEGELGWRPIRQEYVSEEISRTNVSTNAEGQASFAFSPTDEGFYRVAWSSPDAGGAPVVAETTLWVSSAAGGMIGYRSGGVEIIVDPEAPAKGGSVPVLITTDTSNRDVLFTVNAGDDLFRAEVVHLEGNSKLVMLDSEERFVPNVGVTADSVLGLEVFSAEQEIRFPPFRNTLAVELTPVPGQAAPGSDARLDVLVKDWEGRPVRGEFAIAVTDEAISYIQEDYAGDPVDFFLGRQRPVASQMTSSLSLRPFLRSESEESPWGNSGGSGPTVDAMSLGDARRAKVFEFAQAAETVESAPAAANEGGSVQVRTDFRGTAFWQPGVVTDAEGRASVSFRYPDSLTTWRAVARGATTGASFGFAETTTRTTKPLIARLQTPRFLVAGDTVEISGVVNNRTDAEFAAKVDLRAEGLDGTPKPQTLQIASEREGRAAWKLSAPNPGDARLTLTAVSGDLNDGMAVDVQVYPNGIEKSVSVAGKAVETEAEWVLDLPTARPAGSESLVVTATPSLAATALDALPYLVRYPYGCVEQTMSRFLPAVVTLGTLEGLGLDRRAIANRMFGGIEPEFLSRTHPDFTGDAGLEELNALVAKGLDRLYSLQHEDGAWGWWKGEEPDAFMTAYVVWGLRLAQKSGVGVKADVLERGIAWLRRNLVGEKDELDRQAWMLHALAAQFSPGATVSDEETAAVQNLWERRDELTSYGRALFALALHAYGDREKSGTLARNLHDGVTRDAQPGVSPATAAGSPNPLAVPTAHWGSEGLFRRWQDGGVEATAFALQALLAIDPKDDLVEPAMNWLVKNRRGAQWSNTRDTAIVVLAMNAYLAQTKELDAEVGFEIEVNGKLAGQTEKATALDGQAEFEIDRALLADGPNRIILRRTSGAAPLYFSARAEFFTLEEPIPPAGNEMFVKREYFRYAHELTLLDGYRYNRVEWAEGETSSTDQRVEVVLTIDAKNDLEYLVFEDLKPAGLEAVDVRSGERMIAEGPDGKTVSVYCELRDRKVALFLRKLPQGVWKIRYDLRAETVGDFSALPVIGHAMYVPEIRCNGASRRVKIEAER